MKKVVKTISPRTSLIFLLYLFLIPGILSFTSCNKKREEELNQQVQSLQAQLNELKQEVASKESEINQLKEENATLQTQIPESRLVQEGDNHYQISFDYLTQKKGVPEEEAKRLLADAPLLHPLVIGFKVWNYFYDRVFGTFVTQGEALVSPAGIVRIEKRKIKEEKLRLENEIAELEKANEELRNKIGELEKESEVLKTQVASLTEEINNLTEKNKELESKLNSVYYLVDTKDNLKTKGIINVSFLGLRIKIGEIKFGDFQNRVDLRESNVIEIKAADFQLTAIKKVKLLPKYMEENKDYRIEIAADAQSAMVHLLNKDKFLLSHIILILH